MAGERPKLEFRRGASAISLVDMNTGDEMLKVCPGSLHVDRKMISTHPSCSKVYEAFESWLDARMEKEEK